MMEVYTSSNCNFDIHATYTDGGVKVSTKGLRRVVMHHPGYSEVVAQLLTREQAEAMCEEIRAKHADKALIVEHVSYKKELFHKQPEHPRQDDPSDVENPVEVWERDRLNENEINRRARELAKEMLTEISGDVRVRD
jgi:hypothetical protein